MTTLNVGNSLGYSFHPHKVTLQYFEKPDPQLELSSQQDPELTPLLNEFMACEKSGTGWNKMQQENAHALFNNLSHTSQEVAQKYNKNFNDEGFGQKVLALDNGSVGVLTFIPFVVGP